MRSAAAPWATQSSRVSKALDEGAVVTPYRRLPVSGIALLRVGVVGATGAVGEEVLGLLQARRFPLQELAPIATERSLGTTVDVLGHELPVLTESSSLKGIDLAFVCTPRAEALPWVRAALEHRVVCIDLSGAAAEASEEVPLLAADLEPGLAPATLEQPVLGAPAGASLAWARVLAPVHRAVGLRRVVGTAIEAASAAGRAGIAALETETVALFNQQEPPVSAVFEHGIAFDCLPSTGVSGSEGQTDTETVLVTQLHRLLGIEVPVAITSLRVPTFAGSGASLALETEQGIAPVECRELLSKAPGVTVWDETRSGPSMRETVGEEDVLVGRIRSDPSREGGILLWLAADPIRLAASNAVRLAEARFAQR
jgi:aspartate-semialdehyde dehydrogenase